MSTLKVDNIESYSGGDVTLNSTLNGTVSNATTASYIAGANVDGAVATAENLTAGNKTHNGSIDQTFSTPGTWGQNDLVSLTGASINGTSYNTTFFGVADFSPIGYNFEDYFTIEYYNTTGFTYNFGSELNVNGIQTRLATQASGSAGYSTSELKTTDNGDGTSKVTLRSDAGQVIVTTLGNYADDTAAASGGVPVNGMYRSGSQLMIRVS